MPLILPLELQLHILELALPPIIRSRLDERVRLCKTFSLVHRTWTPFAQRELHEHITCTGEAAYERLAAAQEGGWPVKRIHVHAYGLRGDELYKHLDRKDSVEMLWVANDLDGGELLRNCANLKKLSFNGDYPLTGPSLLLHALSSQLSYLAIHGVNAPVELVPSLPQLRTLLLSRVEFKGDTEAFLKSLKNLRKLGVFSSEWILDIAPILPSTLRHLAYDEWLEVEEGYYRVEGEAERPTMARLAASLVSCTVVMTGDVLAPWSRVLREEVERQGGRFTELDEPVYDWAADDWDLEEWAWSVGA